MLYFAIGEIYKDDLRDKTRADATFEEFLHRYPRNQFAEAARLALAEPAQQRAGVKSKAAIKMAKESKPSSAPGNDNDADIDSSQDKSLKETNIPAEGFRRKAGPRAWNPALVYARLHARGD